MYYLSGGHPRLAVGVHPKLGVILTPVAGYRMDLSSTVWAMDTGCFTAGDRFNLDRYVAYLRSYQDAFPTCLFATAPDVVGDPDATWQRSQPVLPMLRAMGLPAALCAQDGIERGTIPWDTFDALFIGGSTEWKLNAAYDLVPLALERGKWVHMGRVNSLRRMRAAVEAGIHSCDGTMLAFGPDVHLPKVVKWLNVLGPQRRLWDGEP